MPSCSVFALNRIVYTRSQRSRSVCCSREKLMRACSSCMSIGESETRSRARGVGAFGFQGSSPLKAAIRTAPRARGACTPGASQPTLSASPCTSSTPRNPILEPLGERAARNLEK